MTDDTTGRIAHGIHIKVGIPSPFCSICLAPCDDPECGNTDPHAAGDHIGPPAQARCRRGLREAIADVFRILRQYEHGNMVDSQEAERSIYARLDGLVAAPQEPRLTENERLRAELEERDATFRLRWDADMRAIATWQAEDPERRSLIWPDHADMVVWLLNKLDQVYRDLQQYHDGGTHSLAAIDQILAEARIDAA